VRERERERKREGINGVPLGKSGTPSGTGTIELEQLT
jgi:hypothetical protein